MKKVVKSLIYLVVVIFCASCTATPGSKPSAMGKAGELLIVMKEHHWQGACGDSLRHYLSKPVRGLPMLEPMFTLSQTVELTNFLQKFRNILIVNIDAGLETTKLGYKSDVYARYQLIFNIDAPSPDSVIACMYRNRDLFIDRILTKDRDAIIEDCRKSVDPLIVDRLREKFQVNIIIPKSYSFTNVEDDNFVWIAREEGERNWYILMWKEPYRRKGQLETDSLIFKMNAMTKKYVHGETPGSYMADEPMVIPAVKRFEKDGIYTVQINGLWQTEGGDFKGGPYVNHTIVDVKRGQLVTGIGFVFYPNRDKRDMVRQLEAILYTMKPVVE